MAYDTDLRLLGQMIYSVFVRNHTPEGTFAALEKDLDRIAALGTDILWLLPIHPIGLRERKGSLGSPYAISDFRGINPEYGTMEDFRRLVDAIHARGMRCMIDVVYNHTAPDSWLAQHHPEWFFRDASGNPANRTPDWTDVVDLDYAHRGLWDYQIETLRMWAGIVDGFRCDVASLVPLDFWLAARASVREVNPDCVWLAESVEPTFIREKRAQGAVGLSDGEVYQAFDICYDYDIKPLLSACLRGDIPLSQYVKAIAAQEVIYPANYIKLRFLENHDNSRARAIIPDDALLRNWTAFMYLLKGTALVYAGQEKTVAHLPSLFDRDEVDWHSGEDWQATFARLHALKQHPLLTQGNFTIHAEDASGIAVMAYADDAGRAIGVFALAPGEGDAAINLPDGMYQNEITQTPVKVASGAISAKDLPVWLLA